MPFVRKRRAVPDGNRETEHDSSDSSSAHATQRQTQRRRISPEASDAEHDSINNSHAPDTQALNHSGVMVKKLVRLAIASEYSRTLIRRNDINQKVLGPSGSRDFKNVFAGAQKVLKEVFGMQMIEQPLKEKITISQRRAAQRVEKPAASSKTWTVVSTLPTAYKAPEILPPPKVPSSTSESIYVALYTFIISLIMLSGGSIAEQKLDRYLRRVKAETYTPVDNTERLLARLCKEGYLVRNRDIDTGEEVVEYYVGPRGKIEVGRGGVSGLVREVYGFTSTGRPIEGRGGRHGNQRDTELEDFEGRLKRSLGIRTTVKQEEGRGES
ncbi:hypothetical protein FQN57_004785 [Myotisia sp. PD_48]|nr:hypothetical protein FQN57_004785 [Myotisia sp. PD_48]